MKSKAMVVTKPGQMELQEFELQPTHADHVLVKAVRHVGLLNGSEKYSVVIRRWVRYPLVMGHEIACEVVDVGSQATGWYDIKTGDRITVEPYIACGRCKASRSDHFYHLLHPRRHIRAQPDLRQASPPCSVDTVSSFYLVPGTIIHKQNIKHA